MNKIEKEEINNDFIKYEKIFNSKINIFLKMHISKEIDEFHLELINYYNKNIKLINEFDGKNKYKFLEFFTDFIKSTINYLDYILQNKKIDDKEFIIYLKDITKKMKKVNKIKTEIEDDEDDFFDFVTTYF